MGCVSEGVWVVGGMPTLCTLLVHDAVLIKCPCTRMQPTLEQQMLVELAQERDEDIPALVYEGRPVVRCVCVCACIMLMHS